MNPQIYTPISIYKEQEFIYQLSYLHLLQTDGIVSTLLQQRVDILLTHLCLTFTACVARGYIPKAWRPINLTIIPPPRKANYTGHRHILLLVYHPSCWKQLKNWWAGISGMRFCDYVLCINTNLPTSQGSPLKPQCIMWSHIQRKHYKKGTSYFKLSYISRELLIAPEINIITKAAKQHGLWEAEKSVTLTGENLKGSVTTDCPHGDVLLLLMWSLVVDKLIRLSENEWYTLGYADDIAILICGKFLNTVSELVQEALTMVQQWCDRTQLSINPQKMMIVPFIGRRDLRGLNEPSQDTP